MRTLATLAAVVTSALVTVAAVTAQIVLAPSLIVPVPGAAPVPTVTVTVDRIEEDEPGWDCRTMGNRRCGPGASPLNH